MSAGTEMLGDLLAIDRAAADAPHESGDDRYAIYAVAVRLAASLPRDERQRRICETSRDGIGLALVTLREEEQITNDSRVGIFDRLDRVWIVNPWAKGTL